MLQDYELGRENRKALRTRLDLCTKETLMMVGKKIVTASERLNHASQRSIQSRGIYSSQDVLQMLPSTPVSTIEVSSSLFFSNASCLYCINVVCTKLEINKVMFNF